MMQLTVYKLNMQFIAGAAVLHAVIFNIIYGDNFCVITENLHGNFIYAFILMCRACNRVVGWKNISVSQVTCRAILILSNMFVRTFYWVRPVAKTSNFF